MYSKTLASSGASGCSKDSVPRAAQYRFTWRGDTYTLEATEDGDWFDGSFLDKLGGIIRQKSGGKKLFFCSDGYQATLIFYRDDSWAEEFQREIGLQLERQLP